MDTDPDPDWQARPCMLFPIWIQQKNADPTESGPKALYKEPEAFL
jgi:hypothetical protein